MLDFYRKLSTVNLSLLLICHIMPKRSAPPVVAHTEPSDDEDDVQEINVPLEVEEDEQPTPQPAKRAKGSTREPELVGASRNSFSLLTFLSQSSLYYVSLLIIRLSINPQLILFLPHICAFFIPFMCSR